MISLKESVILKEYTISRDEKLETTSIESNYPEVMIAYKEDIAQEYSNPFSNIYPFSQFGRVLSNKDSDEIIEWLHETDSTLKKDGSASTYDETKHDAMCHFPKFYYKRVWNGDVLEESWIENIPPNHIDDIPKVIKDAGYSVYPCFVDESGNISDYVLYGAFKGYELGSQLRSIVGYTPTVSKTISYFRDRARQGRSVNFNIETWGTISMIQTLYKFAFKDLNAQKVIGQGWTNKSASTTTGATMKLGNRSGYLGVNYNQISLFGIEDFYGNVWSFVDGMLVTDAGYHTTYNSLNYGDLTKHELYACTPLMATTDNNHVEGYVKNIEKTKIGSIPKTLGGSDSKWYSDYLWSHRKTQTNICLFGAHWAHGARAGAFCLSLNNVASDSYSLIGARPVCLKKVVM
ncbi:MAG: hypothetical protein ACRCX2_27300 [Paraclostridium sp.]